jgi:hypothetical protein
MISDRESLGLTQRGVYQHFVYTSKLGVYTHCSNGQVEIKDRNLWNGKVKEFVEKVFQGYY